MTDTILFRATPEFFDELFVRDAEGNKLTVDVGEPADDGFHTPTVIRCTDDNIVRALRQQRDHLAVELAKRDHPVTDKQTKSQRSRLINDSAIEWIGRAVEACR